MKQPDFSLDPTTFATSFVVFWHSLDSKTLSSILLLTLAVLARWLILKWLEKDTDLAQTTVIRWRQRTRYISLLFVGVALLIIWAPQLRTFAVSIVAVAAALVLAFKELITCLTGAIIRASVEGARIGGRITIDTVHGDVVASNILSTVLIEVNDYGQRTGRTIVVPNSQFLSKNVYTDTLDEHRYVLMMVPIPMQRTDDWHTMQDRLIQIGTTLSEPYIREAKKKFNQFNKKFGLNAPGPEPKVIIDWHEHDKIILNLRMAVPVTEQNSMRQEVYRAMLDKPIV